MNKCYICKQTKPNPEMLECRIPGNVGNVEIASYDFICKQCFLKANPKEKEVEE